MSNTLQLLIDRLRYNQLCAPDYPEEDQNTLSSEMLKINKLFEELILKSKEPITQWFRLAQSSTEKAFNQIKSDNADSVASAGDFTFAIRYLRNASKKKQIKPDFIVGGDGNIHKAD